jgi:hypothetical protein
MSIKNRAFIVLTKKGGMHISRNDKKVKFYVIARHEVSWQSMGIVKNGNAKLFDVFELALS